MPLGFTAEANRALAKPGAVVKPRVRVIFTGRRNDANSAAQTKWDHYFTSDEVSDWGRVRIGLPRTRFGAFDAGTWSFTVARLLPDVNPDSPLYDPNQGGSYGGYLGAGTAQLEIGVVLADGTTEYVNLWKGVLSDIFFHDNGSATISCIDNTKKLLAKVMGRDETLASSALDFTAATNALTVLETVLTHSLGAGLNGTTDLDADDFDEVEAVYTTENWKLKGGGAAWDGTAISDAIAQICRQSFMYLRPKGDGKLRPHTLFPGSVAIRYPRLLTDERTLGSAGYGRSFDDTITEINVAGTNTTTTPLTDTIEPWHTRFEVTDDYDDADLLESTAAATSFAGYEVARRGEPWARGPSWPVSAADADVDLMDEVAPHGENYGTGNVLKGLVFEREWDPATGAGAITFYEDPWSGTTWMTIGVSNTRDLSRIF